MDEKRFDDVITRFILSKPFIPFVVTLADGERIEVTRKFQAAIGGGATMAILDTGRPRGMTVFKKDIVSVDALEPAH